jgi:hypothetical protein
MTAEQLPEKRLVLCELLKEAWIYVHIDPRRDGVILPDFLRDQPRVVLQYGYNMPVPLHDLTIDERGIGATLSFRRTMHATFIPWSAVFAMTDGEKHGMVWPDDVPPDPAKTNGVPGGYDQLGFRVPAVIVSPYARRDHVSHVVHDHTTILRLIETKWNLGALTFRDANASNLLDSLDLDAPPAFATPPRLATSALPPNATPTPPATTDES